MAGNDVHAWIQFGTITFPLRKHGMVRIGRSIESDVRLFEDPGSSRDHCVIKSVKDKVEVTDLDSRNGTSVNGRPIHVATKLFHNDVITVGDSKLTILFEMDSNQPKTDTGFTLKS